MEYTALREQAEAVVTALEALEESVRARLDHPEGWSREHLAALRSVEGELPRLRRLVRDSLRRLVRDTLR
jgi:hypothetical protein